MPGTSSNSPTVKIGGNEMTGSRDLVDGIIVTGGGGREGLRASLDTALLTGGREAYNVHSAEWIASAQQLNAKMGSTQVIAPAAAVGGVTTGYRSSARRSNDRTRVRVMNQDLPPSSPLGSSLNAAEP